MCRSSGIRSGRQRAWTCATRRTSSALRSGCRTLGARHAPGSSFSYPVVHSGFRMVSSRSCMTQLPCIHCAKDMEATPARTNKLGALMASSCRFFLHATRYRVQLFFSALNKQVLKLTLVAGNAGGVLAEHGQPGHRQRVQHRPQPGLRLHHCGREAQLLPVRKHLRLRDPRKPLTRYANLRMCPVRCCMGSVAKTLMAS